METPPEQDTEKKTTPIDLASMSDLLDAMKRAMDPDLEDMEQAKLVEVIQKNRAFILEYAMAAYLNNPKSASLLEGVTQMMAQIEKTVRDNRKEAHKKKEQEGNRLSFNQMLDAMQRIQDGAIQLPKFDFTDFILDPSKSLLEPNSTVDPIKEDELVQGNVAVDINGNRI